jgi:hypothetical protein
VRVQVPVDYSGMPTATLARQCEVTIASLHESNDTVAEFFGPKKGLQLLAGLQSFAMHVGGAKKDLDFGYLQLLQDTDHDLVPDHRKDGEDVDKYFRRASPVMNAGGNQLGAQPA